MTYENYVYWSEYMEIATYLLYYNTYSVKDLIMHIEELNQLIPCDCRTGFDKEKAEDEIKKGISLGFFDVVMEKICLGKWGREFYEECK